MQTEGGAALGGGNVSFRQKSLAPIGNGTKVPRTPRPQSDHRAGGAKLCLTETMDRQWR